MLSSPPLFWWLMGNRKKQDQSAQRQLNDYEKSKMQRVQENQDRLRELGITNIVNSLTSLVEIREKPVVTNERDVDYVPNFGGDSEEDNHDEVTTIGLHQNKRRPQYIAPMSMNRYASLAKQRRVTALAAFGMLQFKETCHQNGVCVDSNATKTKATITMGELIMNRKGSQLERDVVKQNLVKPSSLPRRKLFLVDEDDERLQGIDGSYMEQDSDGDDPNKWDDLRSQEM